MAAGLRSATRLEVRHLHGTEALIALCFNFFSLGRMAPASKSVAQPPFPISKHRYRLDILDIDAIKYNVQLVFVV